MDYYYRVKNVPFWNKFLHSLEESGKKERNEEHHLLPQHFLKTSYFGVVRPYSGAKVPFPPPPPPPTSMPHELTTILKVCFACATVLICPKTIKKGQLFFSY